MSHGSEIEAPVSADVFDRVPPRMRRNVKDSVFSDVFSRPRWLLELYRAIHPEDETVSEADLELVTIERVITAGEYNDLGFMVRGRLVVLVESQTKWTPNIAVRALLYLAETYRRHIEVTGQSLHQHVPVELPAPELYVIYTGEARVPDEVSFCRDVLATSDSPVEAVVKVLTGNKGDVVEQYVESAHLATEIARMPETVNEKARLFVETCIERGILKEYFTEMRTEATGMMFTLFDQERETEIYLRSVEREARERGLAEGIAEGVAQGIERGIEQGITRMADSLRAAGVDEAAIRAAMADALQGEM